MQKKAKRKTAKKARDKTDLDCPALEMRKANSFMAIAFGIFIVAAAVIVPMWLFRKSRNNPIEDKPADSANPSGVDDDLRAIRIDLHRFIENDKIYKDSRRASDAEKDRRERLTAAGLWAYTILTAGLLVIGAWSLEANRRQIVQTQIISRARVGIDTIDKPNLTPSQNFRITIRIKNFGGTTAFNVANQIVLHSLQATEGFEPIYGPSDAESSQSVMESGGIVLLMTKAFPITQDQIDAVSDGRFTLHVYGRIDYDDVYGAHHQMTFCRKVISEQLIEDCATYNDSR